MGLLSQSEAPILALRGWGGSLWRREAIADLAECELSNRHFLEALRCLAFTSDRGTRRAIDYRNLDFEEIGSVYEALLELTPAVSPDGTRFNLTATGRGERRQTGSFYTPHRLVNFLLEGTVAPLLADIWPGRPGAESRLLALRVCDPACGSGHFLVAAGRLIAKTLARVRTGEEEPSPAAVRVAFRDVASRCLFGMDINPLPVDLCKFSLWIESLEPGRPLPDFEAHIEVGDSLVSGFLDRQSGFDVVLMNPPFGAVTKAGYRQALGASFELATGRFDSCAVFVECGLRLLKDGGLLGIVLPHAVTRTGGYAALRRLITAHEIRRVGDAGSAFPGVNLEVVCVCIGRRTAGDGVYRLDDLREPVPRAIGEQDAAFLVGRPTIPMYVPRGAATDIVRKMEAAGAPLAKLARISRGASISARDPAIGMHPGIPVVRGRDIHRYALLDAADLLALRGSSAKGLPWPRLCIQNIASRINGTIVPAGYLPLDTVNVIDFEDDALDVYAMMAVLNSEIVNWYVANVLLNHAALTVHMDTPIIGHLPVVVPEESVAMTLAQLARNAMRGNQGGGQSQQVLPEIEGIVKQMYGLS